ncbi:hypothetical protein [Burkholderia sp. PAMC 28687]|uniref:hypothetical protein n=1 Tax=Burkholderia sp. PAMC 28687 TaxID=1795874 RepID=UPI000AA07751|nr:hypothetical protein [Burkholderia sp. PAMC 28687]
MNITTSQVWAAPTARASTAHISTKHDSGEFQTTLRSMEKDMWSGAESEIPGGHGSSVEQSRRSSAQTYSPAMSKGAPVASMTSSSTSNEFVDPSAGRIPVFITNGDSSTSATSFSAVKSLLETCRRTLPDAQANSLDNVHEPIFVPCAAPEPAAPTRDTRRIVARAPAYTPANLAPPSSNANSAAPYRLSVSVEGSGVSIALRIHGATPDDLARLKQKALTEARRHGGRDVRLVVNGVDQITTYLVGASNGY